MDNQLIQSSIGIPKSLIIIIVLVVTMAVGLLGIYWHQNSDPYIQEVLSLEGDTAHGRDIFQINCSGCHGSQLAGSVGPSLKNVAKHKSKSDIIKQVVSGQTPPMPKFQPNPQEMADLLNYLEKFGKNT